MRFRWARWSVALLVPATVAGAQRRSPICFSGPIREACSGFVIFEASAMASTGPVSKEIRTSVPVSSGPPTELVTRVHDLPSYFSGALGYLHVVDTVTALGVVAELGYGNRADLGNTHRVAITGRARRKLGDFAADVGAGPLGVEVFVPSSSSARCCNDRVIAYGGTAEGAMLYRGILGVAAGADLVHGGGRTSFAVHGGLRSGSYGTVVAAILTAAGAALVFAALAHGD